MTSSNAVKFFMLLLALIGNIAPDGQAIIYPSPSCLILNAYLYAIARAKIFSIVVSLRGWFIW